MIPHFSSFRPFDGRLLPRRSGTSPRSWPHPDSGAGCLQGQGSPLLSGLSEVHARGENPEARTWSPLSRARENQQASTPNILIRNKTFRVYVPGLTRCVLLVKSRKHASSLFFFFNTCTSVSCADFIWNTVMLIYIQCYAAWHQLHCERDTVLYIIENDSDTHRHAQGVETVQHNCNGSSYFNNQISYLKF